MGFISSKLSPDKRVNRKSCEFVVRCGRPLATSLVAMSHARQAPACTVPCRGTCGRGSSHPHALLHLADHLRRADPQRRRWCDRRDVIEASTFGDRKSFFRNWCPVTGRGNRGRWRSRSRTAAQGQRAADRVTHRPASQDVAIPSQAWRPARRNLTASDDASRKRRNLSSH